MLVLILSFVSGLLAGVIASLLAMKYYEWATCPKLETNEDETDPTEGGQWCGYHIKVKNLKARWPFKVRRPAWNTKATIEILNESKAPIIKDVIDARWPKNPEPLSPALDPRDNRIENLPDFSKLFIGRLTDIYCNAEQKLDIAMKFDGEDDFYIFSNESYLHNSKKPEWRVGRGKYLAIVRIYYEYGIEETILELSNKGNKKDDFFIRKILGEEKKAMGQKNGGLFYWLSRTFYFVFKPKRFVDVATDESIEAEFRTNAQLAERYPDKVLPSGKRHEFKKGQKEHTQKMRGSICRTFLLLFCTILVSAVLGFVLGQFFDVHISADLLIVLRLTSVSLIFWGVLGKLGWEIQTWRGETLPERINSLWHKGLYIMGIFLLMFTYFSEVFEP